MNRYVIRTCCTFFTTCELPLWRGDCTTHYTSTDTTRRNSQTQTNMQTVSHHRLSTQTVHTHTLTLALTLSQTSQSHRHAGTYAHNHTQMQSHKHTQPQTEKHEQTHNQRPSHTRTYNSENQCTAMRDSARPHSHAQSPKQHLSSSLSSSTLFIPQDTDRHTHALPLSRSPVR